MVAALINDTGRKRGPGWVDLAENFPPIFRFIGSVQIRANCCAMANSLELSGETSIVKSRYCVFWGAYEHRFQRVLYNSYMVKFSAYL